MSKYNSYAVKADEAFKEARKIYGNALEQLINAIQAEKKVSKLSASDEKYIGENETKKAVAAAHLSTAKHNFETAKNAWTDFDETLKSLREQLAAELSTDSTVKADAVDSNALELLKSGVMNLADYQVFAKKYADNPTMLRLCAQYAQNTANSIRNNPRALVTEQAKARELDVVVRTCNDGADVANQVLAMWDEITGGFNKISSRTATSNNEFVLIGAQDMLAKYDTLMERAIASF